MFIKTDKIKIKTKANGHMVDITKEIQKKLEKTNLSSGIVNIFIVGSTAAISTVEFEIGLQKDIPKALERLIPSNIDYEHHKTWGDNNGKSHVQATFLGPSLTVPFEDSNLCLGTWQQIVLIECDTKDRSREIVLKFIGEKK